MGAGKKKTVCQKRCGSGRGGAAHYFYITNIKNYDISPIRYIVAPYCHTFNKLQINVIIQSMKQKLSPAARRAKAARDKAYAMTPARRAKKAHAQRERRAAGPEANNKDYDHKDQRWETPKQNRGNEGKGTKSESGNKYATN